MDIIFHVFTEKMEWIANNKNIIMEDIALEDVRIPIQEEQKWGFTNIDDETVITPKYE